MVTKRGDKVHTCKTEQACPIMAYHHIIIINSNVIILLLFSPHALNTHYQVYVVRQCRAAQFYCCCLQAFVIIPISPFLIYLSYIHV